MARLLLLTGSALMFATGCDTGERLTKLEKENQELRAEIKKKDSALRYLFFTSRNFAHRFR